MLRISQIKLDMEEPVSLLPKKIGQKLRIKNFRPDSWTIVKESVDARDKPRIRFIYTVDFEIKEEEKLLARSAGMKGVFLTRSPEEKYELPVLKAEAVSGIRQSRPVVVGFGPCGMFAALVMAEAGLRPIVLERGRDADRRAEDVEHFWSTGELDLISNVQFGEGGAGTFSDGKLTTGIKDIRISKVKEELIEAGADPSVAYRQMPHVGTDVLRTVVKNIREKIIRLGGEVRFESQVTGIRYFEGEKADAARSKSHSEIQDVRIKEIPEADGNSAQLSSCRAGTEKVSERRIAGLIVGDSEFLECQDVVFSPGNSARDTFRMLHENGILLEAKPFSVGVRIEHPQGMIDTAQYGFEHNDTEGRLGAASYKLSYRSSGGRGVYTFCMCPGGYVVGAASFKGGVVTNGMSYHDRSGRNANSALLVDVRPSDYPGAENNPLAGIDFQEEIEKSAYRIGGGRYFAPVQRVGDFLEGRSSETAGNEEGGEKKRSAEEKECAVTPTYRPGVHWTDLSACLPDYIIEAMREALPEMAKRIKGFDLSDAVMTGVETRSSSPVRIPRTKSLESVSASGFYPGGEGAGYAGGIMSAAVDGIKIAEKIIERRNKA